LYTWFGIMALNDWQLIQQMYGHTVDPIDGKPVITFIFFVSFLVMSYYSILNILIAFIIDVYSQLQETVDIEQKVQERQDKLLKAK